MAHVGLPHKPPPTAPEGVWRSRALNRNGAWYVTGLMKHRALALTMISAASLTTLSNAAQASPGTAAQEFTLPAAAGANFRGRFNLADHLGRRPVVVLFWATWCQPCLQELPVYQALFQRYGGRVMVVGVSMDGPDTVSEAGSTTRRMGITFPIVTDLETQVVSVYNTRRAAPFSVWIDRTGTIAREREGFSMSEVPTINAGVAELAGVRPSAPTTPASPAPPPPAPAAPAAPVAPVAPVPPPAAPPAVRPVAPAAPPR